MRSKSKTRVTDLEFVRVWQESDSVPQVSHALGIGYFSATSRAFRLRKKGVKLKQFLSNRGNHKPVDVKALNHLIKTLA